MAEQPTPRERSHDAPLGFTQIYDGKGNARWRCPKISRVFGEFRRCSVVMQKSRITDHIQRSKHQYKIPRERDSMFPEDFNQDPAVLYIHEIDSLILDQVALVSGALNYSARSASSDAMFNFITSHVEMGMKIGSYKQTFSPSADLHRFSRNRVAEHIQSQATRVFKQKMKLFFAGYTLL
jgi:hypothetical protein